MNLSKSKYCSAVQCHKLLWLEQNKPEAKEEMNSESVLDNGTEVGELAKAIFGEYIDIPFDENLTKMLEETEKAIKHNKTTNITEASFCYNNNFCSVDILRKNNNIYEINEVKSSTEIKDIYLEDISYQYYVLTKLGYKVTKANIIYINSKYERHGDLDLNKLFIIQDVTDIVCNNLEKTKEKIIDINKHLENKKEPSINIGMQCVKPYKCPYFKYCTRNLPKNNIFSLRNMRYSTKLKLYNEGHILYEDLLKEDINQKYKEQIEYELYDKKDKIDKDKIKEFLNSLSFPLYFLDFETYQQSIPLYDNVKPYEQIPFQYSLHFLKYKDDELNHKEFLSSPDTDPRRNLAERLVKDIPKDVCILAYNMSFEKTVIKKLAYLFPDLKIHLMNIHDNIKDLMIPFYNRYYYNKDMHGSYSIKYVLPALFPNEEKLNYHNLQEIHNGSEAMNAFKNMEKLSKEEQEELRYNLLKYCELDTLAMVMIWQKLQDFC